MTVAKSLFRSIFRIISTGSVACTQCLLNSMKTRKLGGAGEGGASTLGTPPPGARNQPRCCARWGGLSPVLGDGVETKSKIIGRPIPPSFGREGLSLLLVTALFLAVAPPLAAEHPARSAEAQTERYFEGIRKDPNLLVAFLLLMPKGGDLHNHLSGAIYAETLINWAKDQRACVDPKTFYLTPSLKLTTGDPYCPAPTVLAETALSDPILYRAMIDAYSMRNWKLSGQSGHDHFFDTFEKFGAATHGNLGPMLAETANRAEAQHEIYQELMFTPTGKPFGDMLSSEAVKAIKLTENATPETLAGMRKTLIDNGLSAAVQEAIRQT